MEQWNSITARNTTSKPQGKMKPLSRLAIISFCLVVIIVMLVNVFMLVALRWTKIPNLSTARRGLGLVSVRGQVFAVGGQNTDGQYIHPRVLFDTLRVIKFLVGIVVEKNM